jgi:ribosomal protein S16
MGSKKNPFYRIVVADERAPRDGKFIEELGFYNPLSKELKLDNDKASDWIKKGVQPTETVRSLLKKSGVLE